MPSGIASIATATSAGSFTSGASSCTAFAGARTLGEDAEEHAGAVPGEAGGGSFEWACNALEAVRHRYPRL